MHRNITIRQAEGRRITRVLEVDRGFKSHRSTTKAPGKRFLFNFDLKFGGRTLLVLDPYGYETLAGSSLEDSVLEGSGGLYADENKKHHAGYTLGIDRKTGVIYGVGFGVEKGKCIALVWEFPCFQEKSLRFPKRLLKQIDFLKRAKRPFDISLPADLLVAFIDRRWGTIELTKNLVLQFDFGSRGTLEVWQGSYRFVERWRDG